MQQLRLLADDLTGALDTSAELVGAFGTLNVVWLKGSITAEQGSLVVDTGTREVGPEQAAAIMQTFVPLLHDATIAFKKVDSLLRGPWAAELDAACDPAPGTPALSRRPSPIRAGERAEDSNMRLARMEAGAPSASTFSISSASTGLKRRQASSAPDCGAASAFSTPRPTTIWTASGRLAGDIPDVCCGAEPEASPARLHEERPSRCRES